MKSNHNTHKYRRVENKKTGTIIYRCDLINCTHYVTENLVWNRLSICWKCGEDFVFTKQLKYSKKNVQKKPKCLNCLNPKKTDQEFEKLLGSVL